MNAAAEGLSKSKDFSSTVRPAVPKDLVCESVRTCSLRDEFAPYEMSPSCRMDFPPSREVGIGSDEKERSTEDTPEMGRDGSQSVLGIVGGSLALKLRRRRHMASEAFLRRSWGFWTHDSLGEGLHTLELLFPVCSVWPVVRNKWSLGRPYFPPFSCPTSFGI